MEELLQSSSYAFPAFSRGDIVEGTVVQLGRREILLDIGGKSEALISGDELVDDQNTYKGLKVGDKVLAYVLQVEGREGYPVLSLRRSFRQRRWGELEKAFEQDKILTAKVTGFNRGGLVADLGIETFIPFSHLDRTHFPEAGLAGGPENQQVAVAQQLVGRELQVKIIEMDRATGRLVLSEREAFSEEEAARRKEFFESLEVGSVVEGVVSGILDFGLFVDLGGVEGLIHVSEIAWEKVTDPADHYQLGDKVKVKVLNVDPKLFKVALSIRQTIANPWEGAAQRYLVGEKVVGEVVKVVPFGAFVRVEPGLDGLVHVSETTGPLRPGEQVEAVVLNIEPEARRLGLSVRKVKEAE